MHLRSLAQVQHCGQMRQL